MLPQTRNKLIDLACKNLKSFLRSVKDYSQYPSKYKGRPKLPKYKNEYQWQTIEIPKQSGKIIKEDDKITTVHVIKSKEGKVLTKIEIDWKK